MNIRTVESLVRKSVDEAEPPLRVPEAEQEATLARLAAGLGELGATTRTSRWNQRQELTIELRPEADWRKRYSVRLFFEGDALRLSHDRHGRSLGVPVSGMAQLARFWEAARARVEVARQREAKREKIARLKERSVEGQVAALAGELGFSYHLERRARHVRLLVRLDTKDALQVDLPLSDVQGALTGLGRLITTIRELHAEDTRFQIRPVAPFTAWTEPPEPPPDDPSL